MYLKLKSKLKAREENAMHKENEIARTVLIETDFIDGEPLILKKDVYTLTIISMIREEASPII